jgi:hypothetical protein
MRSLGANAVKPKGRKQTNYRLRDRGSDKSESEILGVLGLWQHITSATYANKLAFAHEAAYFLWMDAQSCKIPRLQDCLRARRRGKLLQT